MRKQMLDFSAACQTHSNVRAVARLGDARRIRQADESIDLIFTSPPYVTALDYSRAHFLAIAWMQRAFEITLPEYKERGMVYIGTERAVPPGEFEVNELLCEFRTARLTLERLARSHPKQAKLAQRYFLDMYRAFGQMYRVLRANRHAILVVCPSHIRKVPVPTQSVYIEMCLSLGFRLKLQCTRTISNGKRILPYMQKAFGKRMSTEYVLVFQKL
jgi:DNA modification methylase